MEQTLGKRIMHHRKRLSLTQDQLAEKLGVTAQAVSKWENDQSCPDISMLPKLSEIFNISTDELLGTAHKEPVYEAEVVDDSNIDPDKGLHVKNGKFEFRYESGRKGALSFALFVCAVGLQLFIARLCQIDISFWSILWPSALITFGLFGLLRGFSFFKIGSTLFGSYFLLCNWEIIPSHIGGELLFPALIILFGLSLLADAWRHPRNAKFNVVTPKHNKKTTCDYRTGEDSFEYSASFGERRQFISIPVLSNGDISTSFGEYTIDLTGVNKVSSNCHISASVSFGELRLLIPKRFVAKVNDSTTFSEVSISGSPEDPPTGTIFIDASANFGEIHIQYV